MMFYFQTPKHALPRANPSITAFGLAAAVLAATVAVKADSVTMPSERVMQDVVAANPKNAELRAIQGAVLYRADKLEEAAAAWEKAAQLNPKLTWVVEMAARARRDAGLEKGFQKTAREHFLIKCEGDGSDDLARTITNMLENIYREVGQRFQSWPEQAFTVILYTDAQFQKVDSTAWRVGVYDGKIRVLANAVTDDPERMTRILSHEYAHALIFRIFGPNIPLWLNEGLAQNSRTDLAPDANDTQAWNALSTAALPLPWTLNAWFAPTANYQQATLAYLETQFFVRWLLERYDLPTVTRWGRELAAGKSIGEATADVFAMSPEQLFEAWDESRKTGRRAAP